MVTESDKGAYQRQEQIHRDLEEVDSLNSSLVVCITAGVQSGNAGSMLSPLVFPEFLVCLIVTVPVGVHIIQELGGTIGLDQGCDISILARRITFLRVGTVAIVRPKSVNSP